MGIARRLLSLALAFESLEESLIVGLGLSWHWDYAGLGISPYQYREMIDRLFAAHGFSEYLTSEPNIRMDPANILVARLGSRLTEESMNRFYQRLFQSYEVANKETIIASGKRIDRVEGGRACIIV